MATALARRAAALLRAGAGRRAQRDGKRRLAPYPRPQQPDLIRARYFAALRAHIAAVRAAAVAELSRLSPEHPDARADAAKGSTPVSSRVQAAVARAAQDLAARAPIDGVGRAAARVAQATNAFQRAQLEGGLKASTGLDYQAMLRREPELGPALADFVQRNVSLVKSMADEYLAELARVVSAGFAEGARWEDLAEELEERTGVAESYAARIARDQVGKLNGQLNALRQQALGIDRYVWRTVNDERVREAHAEMEGRAFTWNEPPEEGHPGEAIQCRCWAEPVLDDAPDEDVTDEG